MRTINLNDGHTVSLYQSIHELPVARELEFNCYLLRVAGIGSTMAAVETHFGRLAEFLAAGRTADAIDETATLYYNLNYMLELFSPEHLAFGCLVAAVDGQPMTDTSEEGLEELLKRLSTYGLTAGHITDEVQTVKKNFRQKGSTTVLTTAG